jgi:receptor-binding and translocation channel-forming TcA subunit of Tc toxin/ABC toxin-like protein
MEKGACPAMKLLVHEGGAIMPGKSSWFFGRGRDSKPVGEDVPSVAPQQPQPPMETIGQPPVQPEQPHQQIGAAEVPPPGAATPTVPVAGAAKQPSGPPQQPWQGAAKQPSGPPQQPAPGAVSSSPHQQPNKPKPPTDPALCRCEDCAAALSPRAYLVDLIAFTITMILDGKTAVNLSSLTALLHQPFSDLMASCDAMNLPIRQARICIEVLRSVLVGQTAVDDSAYRQAAYLALLDRLGVSNEELLLAHTAVDDQRKILAERVGIDLDGTRPDHLDALLFDLSQPLQPTEQNLVDLFGLVDTHLVQLTPPATDPRFLTWRLAHLRTLWAAEPSTEAGAPIIDPDLIDERDFNTPGGANPAYILWQKRTKALSDTLAIWWNNYGNPPGKVDDLLANALPLAVLSKDTLNSQIFGSTALGGTVADLDTLVKYRSGGANVSSQLAALNLDAGSFDRLMELRAFIKSGMKALTTEWNECYNILLQSWKRQQSATWVNEEMSQHIILSPDFFAIPDTALNSAPQRAFVYTPWRATAVQRGVWQDVLRARINQEQTTRAATIAAADDAEGATLARLRDTLLMATYPGQKTLALKAKRFAAQYLLDAQMSACEKTTRVAQAIATLQDFIFAVHAGQFVGQGSFTINLFSQVTFDEQWQWMGSYATWRAMMAVFLYPENVLAQTPHPPNRQTPALGAFLDQLRGTPELTAPGACQAAQQYSDYLWDIFRLDVEASCTVNTPAPIRRDCKPQGVARVLLYLFARSKASGKVYFSTYDRTNRSGYAQSYWAAVPGLDSVEQILGAAPYLPSNDQQQILVFARMKQQGQNTLVVIPYDLRTWQWGKISTLTLPGKGDTFTAAIGQRDSHFDQPVMVVIAMPAGKGQKAFTHNRLNIQDLDEDRLHLFINLLNIEGANWVWPIFFYPEHDPDKRFPGIPTVEVLSLVIDVVDSVDVSLFDKLATDPSDKGPGAKIVPALDNWRIVIFFKSVDGFGMIKLLGLGGVLFESGLLNLGSGALNIGPELLQKMQWYGVIHHKMAMYPYFKDYNSTTNTAVIVKDLPFDNPTTAPYLDIQGVQFPQVPPQLEHLAVHCGDDPTRQDSKKLITFQSAADERPGPFIATFGVNGIVLGVTDPILAAPVYPTMHFDLAPPLFEYELRGRADGLELTFTAAMDDPPTNMVYLHEAYFFVPLALALALQRSGHPRVALEWFRTFYDFEAPPGQRLIYYGFVLEQSFPFDLQDSVSWLSDPQNPHMLAEMRQGCYLRTTLLTLARCLLEDADAEFARDTAGSLERARLMYLMAQTFLDEPTLHQELAPQCPNIIGTAPIGLSGHRPKAVIPTVTRDFCVPLNPLLEILRAYAEVNLSKLRNCRNIAGLERTLAPYDAPTNTEIAMLAGKFTLIPEPRALHPTPYHYTTLIERAKQLAAQAQQIEAAYLSALEKSDAETYTLLKARQDMSLAAASTRLQDLRVVEAQDGVTVASLQQQQHQDQADHYTALIQEDVSDLETAALAVQGAGVVHLHVAAAIKEGMTLGYGGIGDVGNALIATSSWMQTQASYERREQEWHFQQTVALDEIRISEQQIKLATDHVQATGQERAIAQLQTDHDQAVVDFLSTKFTNVELYTWMSNVLGGAYRSFLQQAGSVALTALAQLAFERQEAPPPVVQSDYWDVPTEVSSGGTPDRRGLTGSARLLQDIAQLDQYAFQTNQRKLQLTKTISLAQMAPAEFQRFRETGVIAFATPMALFDRDFPGHYLRLIRRVRTSVVALVPPAQGIHATLSTPGVSRAVIGANYRTVVVRRDPQLVALSSPRDATGLFELDVQSELLLPFEGLGVDTTWELRMPRAANPFDFTTIADVLITIDYTALDSQDYRRQLLQSSTFAAPISADRPFSFRYQFADQWYDLHNPAQTAKSMIVRFTTERADFPPNLDDLMIQQVVLYFASNISAPFEVQDVGLTFTPQGGQLIGGHQQTVNRVISTRTGSAAPNWMPMKGQTPLGEWELDLSGDPNIQNLIKQEEIGDILLVITYSGRTPDWPA